LNKTTTIYNDGNATLTINSISKTSGSSEFTYISPSAPFNIGASSSQVVTIRFTPSSTGSKSATFTVSSNDPDEANISFSVSGTGTTATINDQQKQQEILNMVNIHRSILPAELILAIVRQEGGKGAFYVEGWKYNSFYRQSDAPWAQPTNGDGIMQVTAASGYHEQSGPYTHDRNGYDHAINDGCDYLLENYNAYGSYVQTTLHYNTGPNSLYIYLGKNWGDRDYLSHIADHLSNFVSSTYSLQNPDLVNALNRGQNIVNDYLYNRGITTGQSVEYYRPYQTQLDNDLHDIEVPVSQLPVAVAGTAQSLHSGDLALFDGSGSYAPNGIIASYEWDFGDGETATGCHVSHRFRGVMEGPKEYEVRLTVEDNQGATDTDTITITVYRLERYIPIYSSLSQSSVTSAMPMPPVMEIIVYYNWVNETGGEDEYIVSEVHLDSSEDLNFALYMFSIRDGGQIIWSKVHKGVGREDVSFSYPFNVPRDCIRTIDSQQFTGLAVGADSNLDFVVDGVELGLDLMPSFFRVSYTVELGPGVQTEVPSVYPEAKMAGILATVASPVELRVHDSQGNITGLVNGEVKEEIPNSMYVREYKTAVIFSPCDCYLYQVVGMSEGTYGLEVISVKDGEAATATITAIATAPNATDNYTVDLQSCCNTTKLVVIDETISTNPPNIPNNPSPADGTGNIPINTDLSWNCSDPDGDNLTYYVYFGTDENLALVSNNQTRLTYHPTLNHGTKYYWRVMARDEHGVATEGPAWSFTTQSRFSLYWLVILIIVVAAGLLVYFLWWRRRAA